MGKFYPKINNVLLAEIILLVGLTLDIVIRPTSLSNNSGISYFGIFLNTLPAYVVALSASSYLLARFGLLQVKKYKPVKFMLMALFPFNVLLICFPYDVNRFYADTHQTFGVLIFVSELLISFYILEKFNKRSINRWLISIEFISGLFSAYYLSPKSGFLLQSQIVYQIAFGLILFFNQKGLSKNT